MKLCEKKLCEKNAKKNKVLDTVKARDENHWDFPDKWEKHWTWEEVYIDARRCVFKALENEFSEGFC